MINAQVLPPKMALQLQERALRGEADYEIESGGGRKIYEFYVGNYVNCLVGTNPPDGHVRKVSTEEMARLREQARRWKDPRP